MIIVITGPTGTGKTKLSEVLSTKYNLPIVNADSMQVYKNLDIGTAKVTKEEKNDMPHYLFDIKSPDENYTVYDYQKDVRKILENNKDIILIGGTGLYIKAALYNYVFEEKEKDVSLEELSNDELYEMLLKRNIKNIHKNNRQRMISYLNSSGNNNLKDELLYDDAVFIGLTTNRDTLYKRIDDRVDKMVDDGLLDEVKSVYQKYGKTKALSTGIGYKEIISFLDGDISLDEAIEKIKTNSRHYAKRQYTWFNNQMNIKWFDVDYNDFNNTIKDVEDYIEENN